MRVEKIESGAVLIRVDPGECLLLAEACGRAAEWGGKEEERRDTGTYSLAAAHFEALALLGAAGGHLARAEELLANWTLATTRRDWGLVATCQEVAG